MLMEIDLGGAIGACMFIAFVAIIIAAIMYGFVAARRRREKLRRLAAEWKFDFYEKDPWGLPWKYGRFDLFKIGSDRIASNVLAGTQDGRSVAAFDYQYTTGSGKNKQTSYFHVTILEMPIAAPHLKMRGEGLLDRVASWVGHDDLDFESDEFSRRYYVKCDEPKFAYDVLPAGTIEFLLACGTAPAMEMNGSLLLLYGGRGSADEIKRTVAVGQGILRRIPEYVVAERGVSGKGEGARE